MCLKIRCRGFVFQLSFISLLISSIYTFGKVNEIDISQGYQDSTFKITDIGYGGANSDTFRFSNGLSIGTFLSFDPQALHLAASGGIEFHDTSAHIFVAPDTADTVWNQSLEVPAEKVKSPTIPDWLEDSIDNCYFLYGVGGQEMPAMFPVYSEAPEAFSRRIHYCSFNGRNLKFQLENWRIEKRQTGPFATDSVSEITEMIIRFACDSLGNGKFIEGTSPVKNVFTVNRSSVKMLSRQITRTGFTVVTSENQTHNLLGRTTPEPRKRKTLQFYKNEK